MTLHVDQLHHRLEQRFWETQDDTERALVEALLNYYKTRQETVVVVEED